MVMAASCWGIVWLPVMCLYYTKQGANEKRTLLLSYSFNSAAWRFKFGPDSSFQQDWIATCLKDFLFWWGLRYPAKLTPVCGRFDKKMCFSVTDVNITKIRRDLCTEYFWAYMDELQQWNKLLLEHQFLILKLMEVV